MKQGIGLLFGIFMTINLFANVNLIDISRISNDSKYITAFQYIKDNQQYYNHWTHVWNYDKPKADFIKNLREDYSIFSAITFRNTELLLLLGDISHYLYNLDDSASYSKAVDYYNSAIKSSPKDYRGYWFLGYHYALSAVPISATENFSKAEDLLPVEQPADFWEEYAMSSALTNMPSHCIYAMDKVKSITGKEGNVEVQLGPTIYKRIVPVDKDNSYKKEEIWSGVQGEKSIFISRPLGIKIVVDSSWHVSVNDYNKHLGAFIFNPPSLKNKKGKAIDYTVMIMMKAANDNDRLEDFVGNLVSKYPNKNNISISDKYEKMVGFEIIDKNMYQNIGGGHLYIIGIERNEPKYPGLLLENPFKLPQGNLGKLAYYRPEDSKGRFKGKIFYAILLDSCEDINDQSLPIFKNLINNQIIIE